ncbi:MAG: hypothetical protein Q8P83_02215 [bacterium]|nr:hypothetical protein [bacterium]
MHTDQINRHRHRRRLAENMQICGIAIALLIVVAAMFVTRRMTNAPAVLDQSITTIDSRIATGATITDDAFETGNVFIVDLLEASPPEVVFVGNVPGLTYEVKTYMIDRYAGLMINYATMTYEESTEHYAGPLIMPHSANDALLQSRYVDLRSNRITAIGTVQLH